MAGNRGQFGKIQPDHLPLFTHQAQQAQHCIVIKPPRLRGAGGGQDGRIEAVQIEGDVDLLPKLGHDLLHPAVIPNLTGRDDIPRPEEARFQILFADKSPLAPAQGANPHLHKGNAQIMNPAHDTGVRPGALLIAISQVGMGIDLEHGKTGHQMVPVCLDQGRGNAVLAADGGQKSPRLQMGHGGFMDALLHGLGAIGVGLKKWQGMKTDLEGLLK